MLPARGPQQPPGGGSAAVVWLSWDRYLQWLSGRLRAARTAWGERVALPGPWPPGAHGALIGPTGEGKTTHAVGILGLRRYVLALDPKGEDETLARSGFTRVRSLPAGGSLRDRLGADQAEWRRIYKRIDDGRPARVIVGGGSATDDEDAALQKLMRDAIGYCRHSGGWTLYVDEFELLSSQRMFKLGPSIERMLITARRARTSVLTSFQAAAWVSKHATRQAGWVTLWPTGDRDMIKNVAQGMGRDWHQVAEAVDQLPRYHTLTIPRGPRAGPMVLTRAPELGKSGRTGSGPAARPAGKRA